MSGAHKKGSTFAREGRGAIGKECDIANLREAYATTAFRSLEWDEEHERAIDRIAAAGMCHPIGINLWRAKFSLDSRSYFSAKGQLIAHFLARYKSESRDIAERVVDQALHEYLSPECPTCRGAKEVIAGSLRQLCQSCSGTGLRRYSDSDRSGHMQLSFARTRVLAAKIRWALDEMGTFDRAVNAQMIIELERDK